MHLDIAELLALIDADAASMNPARVHLNACSVCSGAAQELAGVRAQLRALAGAAEPPPFDAWPALEVVLPGASAPRHAAPIARAHRVWVLVAVVALFASLAGYQLRNVAPDVPAAKHLAAPPVDARDVSVLVQRSLELQALLAALDGQPTVRNLADEAEAYALRNDIALIDREIARNEQADESRRRLWQTRVRLQQVLLELRNRNGPNVFL